MTREWSSSLELRSCNLHKFLWRFSCSKFIGEHNDFWNNNWIYSSLRSWNDFLSMDTVEESMNTLEDIVGVVFIFAGLTVLLLIT